MSDEGPGATPSPFKYHLELTPAQLKLTHTALRSLLDDFGHEESEVQGVIREVLDKLPDEHAIRAIRLDDELRARARLPAGGERDGRGRRAARLGRLDSPGGTSASRPVPPVGNVSLDRLLEPGR